MLRDATGKAVSDRAGSLVLYRPNGLVSKKVRFEGSEAAAVQSDFELPKGASRGEWRVEAQMDGLSGASGTVRFSVEDFVPQRIAVDLAADEETPVKLGGTRDVEVSSRFLYGAPALA